MFSKSGHYQEKRLNNPKVPRSLNALICYSSSTVHDQGRRHSRQIGVRQSD
jgi:hypothetical protein